MIEETLDELNMAISKAHSALRRELSRIRTGRASPELLDTIRVDYYGTPTPIQQMASVSVPEPRMLVVKPWDRSNLTAIERAIMQSPLELNPQNDGEIIRLPMPSLTEERRKELAKLARKHGEDCKVAIRKARHDSKDMLASLEKEGEASEDEVERALKKMEEIVQKGTADVDATVERKEKDIIAI